MRLNSTALAALRFFEATARHLSFRRAASELSVTQGAVSHQIKYLEEYLGCKLFYRLPKQIKLTKEGEQFASVVVSTLQDLNRAAEAVVAQTRSAIDVILRAGPSFALRWLVPRLTVLYALHPNIRLRLIGAYGYFDPVHRDFDLAIEYLQGTVPALCTEILMQDYLTPVCTPHYLAEHGFLKSPQDLVGCVLLHDADAWPSADEDAEWRYWLEKGGAPEVRGCRGQFFSLADMAIEAALAHQGVAMGRRSLVQGLLATNALVAPFSQWIESPTRYCLVYPKEAVDRPGIKEVIQWLRDEAQGGQQ